LARSFAVVFIRESASAASTAFAAAAVATTTIIATPIVATAIATTAIAAGSRAARRSCLFGTSFVNLQIAPADIFSIESGDRLSSLGIIRHFDKRESAGSAGLTIHGNVHACNLTKSLEKRTQVALGSLETHVANKQILHTVLLADIPDCQSFIEGIEQAQLTTKPSANRLNPQTREESKWNRSRPAPDRSLKNHGRVTHERAHPI
jgi:hypothetical protein